MATALDVLEKLKASGVYLEVDVDGRLRFRSEGAPAPPDLEARIAAHREELVDLLRRQREMGA